MYKIQGARDEVGGCIFELGAQRFTQHSPRHVARASHIVLLEL